MQGPHIIGTTLSKEKSPGTTLSQEYPIFEKQNWYSASTPVFFLHLDFRLFYAINLHFLDDFMSISVQSSMIKQATYSCIEKINFC